jgi:hypothetical protein
MSMCGKVAADFINRRRVSSINGKRILQLREQGKSWEEISNTFGTSVKSVQVAANAERKLHYNEGTDSPRTA